MFHYLSQNLVRVRAAWSATDRQTIFREMLALLLLISTAGFVGWSVIKVHKYCPEATSATFLIGIILVTFFAAMGVNLMPTSDGSRLVHFVHRLRLWSTMSWARLVVAGGISLVICVLTYVCLFSALPKVQLAEDVTSLPDCAVGWSLVKVDCVNFPRHLWAPHGKISLFIGEDKVLPCSRNDKGLYRCTTQNASAEIAQRTTPAERLSQGPRKRLLVYLQRSKDLDYEHEILEGFRARLKLQLEDRYEIKFHEAQGSTESYWNSKDRWRAKANEIITGKDAPNVVVTVGSDAASAMTDFEVPERLAERLGPDFKGIYILGVSDPMRAGYARQTSRTGIPLRAVVRYGSGANDWAGTILKIFDTTRLRHKPEFIYDNVQNEAKKCSYVTVDQTAPSISSRRQEGWHRLFRYGRGSTFRDFSDISKVTHRQSCYSTDPSV